MEQDGLLTELKRLQNNRLRHSYADFIAQHEYRSTCDFFFNRVYTVEDTSARDAAFLALYQKIKKVLGGEIITCMELMIQLQNLTRELDLALLPYLAPDFDMAAYERAYVRCDNYEQRIEQIDKLVECLRVAHRIFHRFGIGPGLLALHRFQSLRRDNLATGFLVEGYRAVLPLQDIEPFAHAIQTREIQRLNRIYGWSVTEAD